MEARQVGFLTMAFTRVAAEGILASLIKGFGAALVVAGVWLLQG